MLQLDKKNYLSSSSPFFRRYRNQFTQKSMYICWFFFNAM